MSKKITYITAFLLPAYINSFVCNSCLSSSYVMLGYYYYYSIYHQSKKGRHVLKVLVFRHIYQRRVE